MYTLNNNNQGSEIFKWKLEYELEPKIKVRHGNNAVMSKDGVTDEGTETGGDSFEKPAWENTLSPVTITAKPIPTWIFPPVQTTPQVPLGQENHFPIGNPGNGGDSSGSSRAPIIITPDIRLKYPALAKIVDGLYDKVKNDPKLMEALMKFSTMTKEQILYVLSPGKGPLLTVVSTFKDTQYGEYNNSTTVLSLNEKYVTLLNTFNMDTSKASMFDFFLTSTILHETVHFGNNINNNYLPNIGWADVGAQFENYQYGGDVGYDRNTGNLTFIKTP